MSYEPIKGRLAARPFVVNANNELEVKAFTGDFSSNFVFSANPALTGDVNLAGATTVSVPAPSLGAHATTKTYVDGLISGLAATYVDTAGDTMTGLLTLSGDPTNALHAATKQYVDSVATGLDVKKSVRAATTANITLSGAQTIDGVVLVAGNRVLVKNQTTGAENGIYDVVDPGSWVRSSDSDNSPEGEVTSGMFTFVEEGTVNGTTGWVLSTENPITLGTTALVFTQFSSAAEVTAGDGLVQVGNAFNVVGTTDRISVGVDSIDISANYVGQASITTLGTIGTGVWQGTVIADSFIAAALTGKTYNALTLTSQTNGFTIAGGTTPATLTVAANASVSGTNTGDQTITLTGDVTGSGTGSFATTIANDAVTTVKILDSNVTLAKIANIAADTILGNNTAGAAAPIALTATQAKTVLDLENVENTALSTWAGSTNLTTLGTIGAGTWQGTAVATGFGGTGLTAIGTANQFLAVNSGASALEYRTLAGTANQVIFTASTFTLSLPQDIHTAAVPTFGQVFLGTTTASNHAATKDYVDSLVTATATGLDFKASVRAATTANITLSGLQTIDGVVLVAGDRVLVKAQTDGSQNGIYLAVDGGAWTRSTDADTSAEVTAGMFTFVEEGSTLADTGWVLTTNNTITLGTTSLAFAQFSSAGTILAGDGLTKTGNTLSVVGTTDRISVSGSGVDISANYVGQTSITTLGTVTTGTWNGTVIGDAYIAAALTGKTYNALTLTAQANGFTIAGGSTPATLTVAANASVSGTNTGDQTDITGNAGTATALETGRNINGVLFDGTADITVTAAAGTLTGATLAANVLASSLTSLGTIANLSATLATFSSTVTFSGLTASTSLALNASKELVSVANTGTGNNVLADGATMSGLTHTGTLGAAAANFSGAVTMTVGTASTSTGTGSLVVTGGVGMSGNLFVGGSLNGGALTATQQSLAISTKSANYTVTAGDHTILVDTTSGDITITLPASPETGRIVVVKKITDTTGDVIVAGNGNNIDGAASQTLFTYNATFQLQFNGTAWYVL